MAEQVTQDHRLLKAVVIGLGILLVLGFIALIVGFVVKGGKTAPRAAAGEPLVIPADANIAGMALSERQLVLHVTAPGRDELILVDLSNGRIARHIPVMRATPAPAGTN